MDRDDKHSQYNTIKRLQKNYLIRAGESLSQIIPGTGVKPASQIKRLEKEIKQIQEEINRQREAEMLAQLNDTSGKNREENNPRIAEFVALLKDKKEQLQRLEIC
mmetsp:Transcript_21154/g.46470  ORF Transcript_21154/g.46470 Transcript_21154/m.46470 type:complete len:105 (-) Transcript_21154:140-454(-)